MSQSVLFDAPGPRTVRRHRLYTVLTLWPCSPRSRSPSTG